MFRFYRLYSLNSACKCSRTRVHVKYTDYSESNFLHCFISVSKSDTFAFNSTSAKIEKQTISGQCRLTEKKKNRLKPAVWTTSDVNTAKQRCKSHRSIKLNDAQVDEKKRFSHCASHWTNTYVHKWVLLARRCFWSVDLLAMVHRDALWMENYSSKPPVMHLFWEFFSFLMISDQTLAFFFLSPPSSAKTELSE